MIGTIIRHHLILGFDFMRLTKDYRCGRIIGHFIVHRMVGCILSGSSTIIIGDSCELLRSCDTNGKVYGRWHGTSPCDDERTIALWTNAPRAYEGKSSGLIPPGPRSRESVQFN